MSVIFVAGVHGVGKGYIGIPVAVALGINHFTASQLIREEKGRATWGIDKKLLILVTIHWHCYVLLLKSA